MDVSTSILCTKNAGFGQKCGRKCEKATSNSAAHAGRTFWRCPVHQFVEWEDNIAIPSATMDEPPVMAASSSSSGYQLAFGHQGTAPGPGSFHQWNATNQAREGPKRESGTVSNERIIGMLINLSAKVDQLHGDVSSLEAKLDRVLVALETSMPQ